MKKPVIGVSISDWAKEEIEERVSKMNISKSKFCALIIERFLSSGEKLGE